MLAFSALLALAASPLFANAIVNPSEPSPGRVYNTGADCRVSWDGDSESPTAWKDMNIQLMTGSNLAMVHITTIATDQDGTVDGVFTFPCPAVTLNAPIYFYQFTAPNADVKTWTTRFTIASPSGETVPAPNPTQPNSDGGIDNIPWGTGALEDPSTAVPPPASAGDGGVVAPPTNTTSTTTSTPVRTTPTATPSLVKTTTSKDPDSTLSAAANGSKNLTGAAGASVAFSVEARGILMCAMLGAIVALW